MSTSFTTSSDIFFFFCMNQTGFTAHRSSPSWMKRVWIWFMKWNFLFRASFQSSSFQFLFNKNNWTTCELINFFIVFPRALNSSIMSSSMAAKILKVAQREKYKFEIPHSFHMKAWKKISSASLRCLSQSEITSVSDLLTSHSQLAYACHNFKYLFSLCHRISTDNLSVFLSLSTERQSKSDLRQLCWLCRRVGIQERRYSRRYRTECRWPGRLVALLVAWSEGSVSRKSTTNVGYWEWQWIFYTIATRITLLHE